MSKKANGEEQRQPEQQATAMAPSGMLEWNAMVEEAKQLREMFGDDAQTSGVPIVRIDHDEMKFLWPDTTARETIEGYPVFTWSTRSWYEKPYDPMNRLPPDCYSFDMITPSGGQNRQCDHCISCPQNEWGSDARGKGKACRVRMMLFLLNHEFGFPPLACVVLPITSATIMLGTESRMHAGYLATVKSFRDGGGHPALRSERVWTRLELRRNKGEKFCTIAPTPVRVASRDETQLLAGLRKQFLPDMRSLSERSSLQLAEETATDVQV